MVLLVADQNELRFANGSITVVAEKMIRVIVFVSGLNVLTRVDFMVAVVEIPS